MKKLLSVCAATASLLCASVAVQAAPIGSLSSMDDAAFGVGSITHDSATTLEWLDLDKSRAYSYNYVTSQMGAGQSFDGFRLASNTEFFALVSHSGLAATPAGSAAFDTFWGFAELLGANFAADDESGFGCRFAIHGVTGAPALSGFSPSTHGTAAFGLIHRLGGFGGCSGSNPIVDVFNTEGISPFALADDTAATMGGDGSFDKTIAGFYLVRDGNSVPEPGTLPLVGLALALAWRGKARARQARR